VETLEMAARLYRAEDGEYCASGEAELWIQPSREDLPGRWGGTLRMSDVAPTLRESDFAFRLELEDGREAQTYAELRLDEGVAILDGNGPPPGA
jgi:hypothetical protein